MSDRVIGLDVGSGSVKAAQVLRTDGTYVVEKQAAAPLPHGSVFDGQIAVAAKSQIATIIRSLIEDNNFDTDDVIFGLNSSSSVFMREILVPPVARPEDLKRALPNIIEAEMNLAPDTNEVSYTVVGEVIEKRNRKLKVLVYSVRSDYAKSVAEVIEEAGLHIVGADLNALASLRAVQLMPMGPRDLAAVVDIGSDVTSLMLHHNGVPKTLFFDPDMAGTTVTNRIAEMLDVDIEDGAAEWAKINDQNWDGPVAKIRDEYSRGLAQKVASVFDSMVRQTGEFDRVGHILLVGGGSLLHGLGVTVRDVLTGAQVDFASYDTSISSSSGAPVERYPQAFGADYLVAVGLGMGATL